jgi:hypothetical protein
MPHVFYHMIWFMNQMSILNIYVGQYIYDWTNQWCRQDFIWGKGNFS